MILSEQQIKEAVLTEHKDYKKNVEYEANLDILVNGNNYVEKLLKVANLENDTQMALRKLHSKSTKHVVENLLRNIDKVFTAKGSTFEILFKEGEAGKKKTDLTEKLRVASKGLTLNEFMQKIWAKKFIDSPRSIFLIEHSKEKGAYPVFIKAKYITNWKMKDYTTFDFLVIKEKEIKEEKKSPFDAKFPRIPTDKKEIYRVIDDAKDYFVIKEGDEVTIIQDTINLNGEELATIDNYFGEVPATPLSDIINPNDLENKNSLLDPVLELLSEYLADDSILRIYKFLHGYPYFWYVADDCTHCGGTGEAAGGETCKYCGGTGYKVKKDVSDGRAVRIPEHGEQSIVPNIAGYIQPAIETWEKMGKDLEINQKSSYFTLWGTHLSEDSKYQTATSKVIDTQPINDRLLEISHTMARIKKFITDKVGFYEYPKTYETSIVIEGTQYLLETSDTLLEKYEKGKSQKLAESLLNELLSEYYTAKFQTDPKKLAYYLQISKYEPYIHNTIEEVASFSISDTIKKRKFYISEYIKTLSDTEFLSMDIMTFNKKLDTFIASNYTDNESNNNLKDKENEQNNENA